MPKKKKAKEAADQGDFWRGKTACWELTDCPAPIHSGCPCHRHRQYPCWEIEGTYCKWLDWGTLGQDTSTCLMCKVYLTYGRGQSIELKLRGQGIKLLIE